MGPVVLVAWLLPSCGTEPECLASSSCQINHYCDLDTKTCLMGCLEDADCFAGQTCDADARQCVTKPCESTVLDCALGTICNTGTGECEVPPEPFCESCDPGQVQCSDDSGPCLLVYDEVYCTPFCDRQADCPAGYQCVPLNNGEQACIADCTWLIEQGWL